jgi:hypothetical protein
MMGRSRYDDGLNGADNEPSANATKIDKLENGTMADAVPEDDGTAVKTDAAAPDGVNGVNGADNTAQDTQELEPNGEKAIAADASEVSNDEKVERNGDNVAAKAKPESENDASKTEDKASKNDKDGEKKEDEKKDGEKKEDGDDKKPQPRKLDPSVKRLSMDEWKPLIKGQLNRDKVRTNVVVAYYPPKSTADIPNQTVQETNLPQTLAQDNHSDLAKMPQRIQINSVQLLDELEAVSSTRMKKANPVIMVPPFKVLVSKDEELADALAKKRIAFAKIEKNGDCLCESDEPLEEAETGGKERKCSKCGRSLDDRDRLAKSITHLEVLVDFIRSDLGEALELRRSIKAGTVEKIAFDELWHLFEPGEFIFGTERSGAPDYLRLYRVWCSRGGRQELAQESWKLAPQEINKAPKERQTTTQWRHKLIVDCWGTGFDGTNYGPTDVQLYITPYDGEKPIVELDVYPARFHPQHEQLFDLLLKRGKRFREMDGVVHKTYEGLSKLPSKDTEEVQGEVVIDFKTGYRYSDEEFPKLGSVDFSSSYNAFQNETFETVDCGISGCKDCTYNYHDHEYDLSRFEKFQTMNAHLLQLKNKEHDPILKEHLLILPKYMLAYVFRSRSWNWLDVDYVRDIDEDEAREESGFDELVLPRGHKELVLALVKNHSSGPKKKEKGKNQSEPQPRPQLRAGDQQTSMDLVRGKGKGLIILLHGTPGVGKTSTAETVAAYTRRPLYPITCGDVGQTPEEVEKKMEQHFKLAHRWGCVLLLDEADVFLAKREKGDIVRNGLVSGKR